MNRAGIRTLAISWMALLPVWGVGCGGDARVELSAADTMDRMAKEIEAAFGEYHEEVARGDDRREMRLTSDFLGRVRRDVKNEKLLDQHAADFVTALAKIRADREIEGQRHAAVLDHVQIMREVSAGLREVGLQNLYLDQEMQKYFDEVLTRLAAPSAGGTAPSATRDVEPDAG